MRVLKQNIEFLEEFCIFTLDINLSEIRSISPSFKSKLGQTSISQKLLTKSALWNMSCIESLTNLQEI